LKNSRKADVWLEALGRAGSKEMYHGLQYPAKYIASEYCDLT